MSKTWQRTQQRRGLCRPSLRPTIRLSWLLRQTNRLIFFLALRTFFSNTPILRTLCINAHHPLHLFKFVFEPVYKIIYLFLTYLIGDEVEGVPLPEVLDDLLRGRVLLQLPQLHLVVIELTSRGHKVFKDDHRRVVVQGKTFRLEVGKGEFCNVRLDFILRFNEWGSLHG